MTVQLIVSPGQRALLDPVLLLPLFLSVFLHSDLPDPSDQRQITDRDVHLPPQNHLCSWRHEEEEEAIKILFLKIRIQITYVLYSESSF